MSESRAKKATYWIATGLVVFAFVVGGAMDAAAPPPVRELMAHLGYPPYFPTMLGIWKVLGGLVIAAPGLPRVKEWAYAGVVFDLVSAAVSHAAVGDAAPNVIVPVVLLGLTIASYALRPANRRLDGTREITLAEPAPSLLPAGRGAP